jgi:hypothetical protein
LRIVGKLVSPESSLEHWCCTTSLACEEFNEEGKEKEVVMTHLAGGTGETHKTSFMIANLWISIKFSNVRFEVFTAVKIPRCSLLHCGTM